MIFDPAFKRVQRLFKPRRLFLLFECSSPVQSRKACVSTGVYEFDSVVIGQHVYKRVYIWTPLTDKSASISMWEDNKRHEYSVDYRL